MQLNDREARRTGVLPARITPSPLRGTSHPPATSSTLTHKHPARYGTTASARRLVPGPESDRTLGFLPVVREPEKRDWGTTSPSTMWHGLLNKRLCVFCVAF